MNTTRRKGNPCGKDETQTFVGMDSRLALWQAYNLGSFLRRLGLPKAIKDWSLPSAQVKLINIGGRLVRQARRLVFQLVEAAVPRAVFQGVLERIGMLCPAPGEEKMVPVKWGSLGVVCPVTRAQRLSAGSE